MRRMIDFFPDWVNGGGIFSALTESGDMPWKNDDALAYDIEYYGNRSGNKAASALLERIANANYAPLSYNTISKIVSVIKAKYLGNWERLWKLTEVKYNPIHNYSMKETETPNLTRETSRETDITEETGVETDETITTTEKAKTSRNNTASVYGLGSSMGKTAASSNGDETRLAADNEITEHRIGDADENVRTVHTTGDADSNVETTTETGTRVLERDGNIGVTQTVDMLTADSNFWQTWHVIESIMNDVDNVLCAPYYIFGGDEL